MKVEIEVPNMLMHDIPNVLKYIGQAEKFDNVVVVYNDFYKPFQAEITRISDEKYNVKIELTED